MFRRHSALQVEATQMDMLTKKIIDILVLYGLGKWAESETSNDSTDIQKNGRIALRIPVINDVYRTVMGYVVIVLGKFGTTSSIQ